MSLIPEFRRQRQEISKLEASLVYRVSSRTTRDVTQRKNKNKQTNKQKSYLDSEFAACPAL